jgi:hypothetical protein
VAKKPKTRKARPAAAEQEEPEAAEAPAEAEEPAEDDS